MAYKTRAKTAVKEVRAAVAQNDPDLAQKKLKVAISIIQHTASKKVIHKNRASRKIGRITRHVNQATSSQTSEPASV